MFFVARNLKYYFRPKGDDIMQLPTCSERFAYLGVLDEGYTIARRQIYDRMNGDVGVKGLSLGGTITQGLKQDDLFKFSPGTSTVTITPVLHPLGVPVRAMILPILDAAVSEKIREAVDTHLVPALPDGSLWLQDDHLYHATLYHASSHAKPVPASSSDVEAEYTAIQGVTASSCPIEGVLDRFIVTKSGVVVACWQVLSSGTEPAVLRDALGKALPNAPPPEGQMVREPSILHTTVARLLQPPGASASAIDASAVASAVESMSSALCGLTTTFNEVWFIEERDLLALALNGRYVKHPAPLTCPT